MESAQYKNQIIIIIIISQVTQGLDSRGTVSRWQNVHFFIPQMLLQLVVVTLLLY